MSDAPRSEALSVSAAVSIAQSILADHSFKVVGEVSELSDKPGYKAVYFTIKDDKASLPCLMWKNRYQKSGVNLSLGAEVEVVGKFTIFAPKGRMNFDVSSITLSGEGMLRQQVAQLAEKLRAEGLMDQARKRAIPAYPARIGLVTSPRGAAVHDVLRTLRRRFPYAQVVFAGVPVEGKQAPADLAHALKSVDEAGAEVILLVRGGGSFEDLMPFNDEGLARCIVERSVPVVTGIGHEPDTSIADMVADLRASTPTAAAESVSPHGEELLSLMDRTATRLHDTLAHRLDRTEQFLHEKASRPVFKDPMLLLAPDSQALDANFEALSRFGQSVIERYSNESALLAARLNDLSPLTVLARGWSFARDTHGELIRSVKQIDNGDVMTVRVTDGTITSVVEQTNEEPLLD